MRCASEKEDSTADVLAVIEMCNDDLQARGNQIVLGMNYSENELKSLLKVMPTQDRQRKEPSKQKDKNAALVYIIKGSSDELGQRQGAGPGYYRLYKLCSLT